MGVWHKVTPQAYIALCLQRCVCRVLTVRGKQNVGFGLQPKAEARATPRLTNRMVAGVPKIVSWAMSLTKTDLGSRLRSPPTK